MSSYLNLDVSYLQSWLAKPLLAFHDLVGNWMGAQPHLKGKEELLIQAILVLGNLNFQGPFIRQSHLSLHN